jgi:hypothetical protein
VLPVFVALLAVPLVLPQPIPVRLARYPPDAVFLWVAVRPVVAAVVYADCRAVFGGADDGLDPRRYALLALVLPFVTAVAYLYFRNERRPTRRSVSRYWVVLVAAAAFGTVLLYTAEVFVLAATLLGHPVELDATLVTRTKALGGLVLLPLFPVAAYMDSRYLHATAADWQPNPGRQLALALGAALPVFLLVPVYVGYHLRRRVAA